LEKNPSLDLDGKKQVRIIKQCSDNLLGLINDILDFSVIETRQMTIEISDFNFARLLNECMQISKFAADQKDLKLIVNNNCQATNFLGDEKRIRQILANLIDNAVKYTERGEVKVSTSYENGYLKLSVADTGCGISQDNLEHIFSPFIQVNIDNFSREGIGLGLAIIKELVSLMDGEISVDSQLGMGSIFTISLPLPVSELKNPKVKRDPLSGENQMNDLSVLIVDDSEINLLFLESMLEQIGCEVETAIDGEEALELIGQFNYDFALIDINMPVMNGLELVKRVREQHIPLKLVAVSAYADSDKINEALAAGFDVYLTKPIEEQQLLELIQTVLSVTD
jgi:CheY-like chemotaxis protein/anti-sigma regulatory factor (Ser/Thr protein kinase)